MSAITAAMIGAGGAVAAGGLNLLSQSRQQGNNDGAIQMAMLDYALKQRQLQQQYELSTAGQTDARGNTVQYMPGRGWVTTLTPQSQSMMNRSDAVTNLGYSDALGRGANERSSAYNRRLTEGGAASPLLDAMRYGYGAPSREGVVGADKIAGATAASEGADRVKSGYAASALRTGATAMPFNDSMAPVDRGATAGIRTSLAESENKAPTMYNQMLDQFRKTNLDPYNMLASRASNVENVATQPENISGGLDTSLLNRSVNAGNALAKAGANTGNANSIITAMMGQRMPNYDSMAAGLTSNAQGLYNAIKNRNGGIPWNENSQNDAAYNSWRF